MKELLSKFENGEERYFNDALFHRCIELIYRGADPIKILDDVLKITKEAQDKYSELLRSVPQTIIIPLDQLK